MRNVELNKAITYGRWAAKQKQKKQKKPILKRWIIWGIAMAMLPAVGFAAYAPQAITALTGDITATGGGSVAATLATVNSNTGAFGSSTAIPTITANGKGLITAVTTNAVIAPAGTLSGTTLASGVTVSSLTSFGTNTSINSATAYSLAVTGTALPTPAAGTLGLGGTSTLPTFAANSEGAMWLTSAGGLNFMGQGSVGDLTFRDSAGNTILYTNGLTANFLGAITVVSSTSLDNGDITTNGTGNLSVGGILSIGGGIFGAGNQWFYGTSTGHTVIKSNNTTATNYAINFPAVNGNVVTTGDSATVSNTMLANAATTVNGQTCILGSTCTLGAPIVAATVYTSTLPVTIAATNELVEDIEMVTPAAGVANLPASPTTGTKICIKDGLKNFASNILTVKTTDSSTIDKVTGATGYAMNQNGQSNCFLYVSSTTNWLVM